MDKSLYKGVMVYIEQRRGTLQNVSLELLGKGRKLADELGVKLMACSVAEDASKLSQTLVEYGADVVYEYSSKDYHYYNTEAYTQAVCHAIENYKPEIMLFGATSIGRDLAPRISARVKAGLTADCTSLDIKDGDLMMTRPAFGGNIMATIACPDHRPQMSTVRPGVMTKNEKEAGRKGEIVKVDFAPTHNDCFVEVLSFEEAKSEKKDIQEANILVSGGRGMGAAENFGILEQLAEVLGAEVSASRAAVDSGWQPHSQQVGQTGKTVRPHVYFACGISGAIQHLAGMEESEIIIAINKDKNAKIFEVADLGLVGDLHKVIPYVVEDLKKLAAEKKNF